MKRAFHFRLERVARVRAIEEELARGELRAAEQRSSEAEAAARRALDALVGAREELAQRLAGGRIEPQSVLLAQDQLAGLAGLARRLEERARGERARVAELAQAWRAREVAVRALERLEEKERARHRLALEGQENAQHDETGARRVARLSRLGAGSSDEPDARLREKSAP